MSDGVLLTTNLSELPYGLFHSLALALESSSLWRIICNDVDGNVFCLRFVDTFATFEAGNPFTAKMMLNVSKNSVTPELSIFDIWETEDLR